MSLEPEPLRLEGQEMEGEKLESSQAKLADSLEKPSFTDEEIYELVDDAERDEGPEPRVEKFKALFCPASIIGVENIEGYRPGGYHLVHIGDRWCDDRFEVIHKLGHGACSTVWLARDSKKQTNLAIKVLIAKASEDGNSTE
ncbi:uncharacterized protein BP5553_08244 [Venustampulla echinocandica]|uniref:non-specific serine/threonine protein kinase n=1 Tax=Venustampulla echinocandica TaxID=2656787 RepID=A0A370TG45_9HELO|nr:uncharacterized protein BP5553_08244 [Venustampulla echinocandica]RDL33876.1 hypothetical protein BP5553_08244 [Venustampulla echinocandica]